MVGPETQTGSVKTARQDTRSTRIQPRLVRPGRVLLGKDKEHENTTLVCEAREGALEIQPQVVRPERAPGRSQAPCGAGSHMQRTPPLPDMHAIHPPPVHSSFRSPSAVAAPRQWLLMCTVTRPFLPVGVWPVPAASGSPQLVQEERQRVKARMTGTGSGRSMLARSCDNHRGTRPR